MIIGFTPSQQTKKTTLRFIYVKPKLMKTIRQTREPPKAFHHFPYASKTSCFLLNLNNNFNNNFKTFYAMKKS
jgi:hypothetical protein